MGNLPESHDDDDDDDDNNVVDDDDDDDTTLSGPNQLLLQVRELLPLSAQDLLLLLKI